MKYFILILFLIFNTHFLFSQTIEEDLSACNIFNKTFQPGEEITYIVYYNWRFFWMDAGEVTFRVEAENGEYHLSVVGETYLSYDWFFKIRDYYDTWVDKENLLPSVSIRDVREGGYTLYDKIVFDKENNTAYSTRGRSKNKIKERNTFDIKSCMHDMLSVVYWARNLEFEQYRKGQEFPIQLFADNETWDLKVKYEGKEARKKVKDIGYFNSLVFSPELITGDIFPEDAQMKVWVTDDKNRLPLVIESPLSVGSAKAVLKSYKGLRHPVQSRTRKD